MSCQNLTTNFAADARPGGMLSADGRPQASELCRSFDFTQVAPGTDHIVSFAGDHMATFAGDQILVL